MLATSIRIMGLAKVRLHLWFINCVLIMMWASAFAAYIVRIFPSAQDTYIIWGGMIGQNELDLLMNKVGGVGTLLIFILSALLYLFYLSDETITWIRHKLIHNSKFKIQNSKEDTEEDTEEDTGQEEDSKDSEESEHVEPFSDKPSKTATTIDFGKTGTDNEIILKEGEQTLPLDYPEENMTVVVGQEPEKANLTSGRALEPYDPKLDLVPPHLSSACSIVLQVSKP